MANLGWDGGGLVKFEYFCGLKRDNQNKPMESNRKIKVGITHGDFNGIGYEVVLKALEDNRMLELCTPIVYGSAKIAAYYRKAIEMPQVPFNQISSAAEARDGHNNIINIIGEEAKVEPGQSTQAAGEAAFLALEKAVTDLRNGEIDVLVTAPINKNNIQSSTFTFPGHTEYLEASLSENSEKALMILGNELLRVALVTTHCPLTQVSSKITEDSIVEKLTTFNQSLIRDFGIVAPRIAVLSLNPHAGEGGLLGHEEENVIAPAIAKAQANKILAFGPYAADGLFGSGNFKKFDGVLAMYHDQGLAPFKTIAMESGVNYTAGLPFVRTSPDHGTGYDIAGKGLASPDSMRQAIYMAIDIYRNRARHEKMTRNPLRRKYFDKSPDNVVLDLTKDSDAD